MSEPHPAYPGGPVCQPNCPGPWSSYHDGYADGYESARASARPTVLDLAVAMNTAQIEAREIRLGHDLTVPARRILAALDRAAAGEET